MISRRNLILRLSIIFNVTVFVYLGTVMAGYGTPPLADERRTKEEAAETVGLLAQSSDLNLASFEPPPAAPTTSTAALGCLDRRPVTKYLQRGEYWTLLNYVQAERAFGCAESVTYATHGDYRFLDNLSPLLERWGGPVSLALFAPGEDFAQTLEAVSFARSCLSPMVRELVTFHLYFGIKDMPSKVPRPEDADFPPEYDCEGLPPPLPWGNTTTLGNGTTPYTSYKSRKSLEYPDASARIKRLAGIGGILPTGLGLSL